MDSNNYIALGAAVMTLIVYSVAVFRFIAGVEKGMSERTASIEKALNEKIASTERICQASAEAIRKECELRVDKLAESESKSRHDLASRTSAVMAELRQDMRSLEATVGGVKQDMIRRPDLDATEARIMKAFDNADRSRNEALEKLEKRVFDETRRISR